MGTRSQSWCSLALLGVAVLLDLAPHRLAVAAPALPVQMHFCAANCMTLELRDGHYEVTTRFPWNPPNFTSVWEVVRFDQESFVLHRRDSGNRFNGFKGGEATIAGRIVNGDSLVDITVNAHPDPSMRLSWGDALDATPGSNAERDQRLAGKPPPSPAPSPPGVTAQPVVPPTLGTPDGPAVVTTVPARLKVCGDESGIDACAVWNWTGYAYDAEPGSPAMRTVELDAWRTEGVVLRESAETGATYDVLYSGHIDSHGEVSGPLTIYAPGEGGASGVRPIATARWIATPVTAPATAYQPCTPGMASSESGSKANEWAEAAAKAGDLVASDCWHALAARQGNGRSQFALGHALLIGWGIERNPQLAFFWLDQAAQHGHYQACLYLAGMYDEGIGVTRDPAKAAKWRDEAAFRQQQAKIASQGFDRFLMNLAEGYVESITGVLDQKYASCREDAAAGKAISAECIDVDMRYHAKQVAIREQKREECRRTHRDKTECEH